jgi:penicillin V acylase-like amidase (Ntn superfamily)
MTLDPFDPKIRYKREQIATKINLSEQQKTIVDLYILEENTGKRHWEIDPEDPNVYMEWMYGTNILRNKINAVKAMSARQQKAMYNNNMYIQDSSGNSSQPFGAAVPGQGQGQGQQQQLPAGVNPERIIRTSSGKEVKAKDNPNLARIAAKPKRYPRRSR